MPTVSDLITDVESSIERLQEAVASDLPSPNAEQARRLVVLMGRLDQIRDILLDGAGE